ncbi:unnamed protein product [Caenorhabditis auriculariae]|uniref:Piwi domain-containing protein n=1 Tax=Caenorhabditis auriculariae TaxID=2777116 RepID=A0A8S1HGW9_9PELO|nr:unnamed protein product [Caenorhabditis auriculariae]
MNTGSSKFVYNLFEVLVKKSVIITTLKMELYAFNKEDDMLFVNDPRASRNRIEEDLLRLSMLDFFKATFKKGLDTPIRKYRTLEKSIYDGGRTIYTRSSEFAKSTKQTFTFEAKEVPQKIRSFCSTFDPTRFEAVLKVHSKFDILDRRLEKRVEIKEFIDCLSSFAFFMKKYIIVQDYLFFPRREPFPGQKILTYSTPGYSKRALVLEKKIFIQFDIIDEQEFFSENTLVWFLTQFMGVTQDSLKQMQFNNEVLWNASESVTGIYLKTMKYFGSRDERFFLCSGIKVVSLEAFKLKTASHVRRVQPEKLNFLKDGFLLVAESEEEMFPVEHLMIPGGQLCPQKVQTFEPYPPCYACEQIIQMSEFFDDYDLELEKELEAKEPEVFDEPELKTLNDSFSWGNSRVDRFWLDCKYFEPCDNLSVTFLHTTRMTLELRQKQKKLAREMSIQFKEAGIESDMDKDMKFTSTQDLGKSLELLVREKGRKMPCVVIFSAASQKPSLSCAIADLKVNQKAQLYLYEMDELASTSLVQFSRTLVRKINIACGGTIFKVTPSSYGDNEKFETLHNGETMVVAIQEQVNKKNDDEKIPFDFNTTGVAYTVGALENLGGFAFAQRANKKPDDSLLCDYFVRMIKFFYNKTQQLPCRIVIHHADFNDDTFDRDSFLNVIATALKNSNAMLSYNSLKKICPAVVFLIGSSYNLGLKLTAKKMNERFRIGTFGSTRQVLSGPGYSSFFVVVESENRNSVAPDLYLLSKHRGAVTEEDEKLMGMLTLLISFDQLNAVPSSDLNVVRAARTLSKFSATTIFSSAQKKNNVDWMSTNVTSHEMIGKKRPFWI